MIPKQTTVWPATKQWSVLGNGSSTETGELIYDGPEQKLYNEGQWDKQVSLE